MGYKRVVEFRITIPKFDNSRNPIKRERLLDYVNQIVRQFGGATVYPTVIGFFHDRNRDKIDIDENLLVSAVKEFSRDSSDPEVKRALETVSPGHDAIVIATLIEQHKRFLKDLSVEFGKEFWQWCLFQLLSYLEDSWCPEAEWKQEASPEARADPKIHVFYGALER